MPALEFKGPIEGYVVNYLNREFWRVEHMMDWDDAMQEARLVWVRVCANYPDVVDPPHFMTLFKRLWFTRFTDLTHATSKSRHVVSESSLGLDDDAPAFDFAGSTDNDGYLGVLISEAPGEVISVVSLLLNAPIEFLELAAKALNRSGRGRKDGSKAINRMLGFPAEYDSLGEVERYFTK